MSAAFSAISKNFQWSFFTLCAENAILVQEQLVFAAFSQVQLKQRIYTF